VSFWLSMLISGIAGMAGTTFGAFLAAITSPSNKLIGLLFEAAGGIMLGVVCFDLLPEAIDEAGLYMALFSALAGVLTIYIASSFLEKRTVGISANRLQGLTIAFGLALHNLPEGLAIGSSLTLGISGLSLCAVVALHDVPEGLALALPLRRDGVAVYKAVLLAVLSGLPTLLGAFIGRMLGGAGKEFIALTMGYAGGAMLFVVCKQMLNKREDYNGWGMLGGIAIGVFLTYLF